MPLQSKFGIYRKGFQFVVTTIIDDSLEEEVKCKGQSERDKIKEIKGRYKMLHTELAKL